MKRFTKKPVILLDLNGFLVHNNRSLGSGNLSSDYAGGDPKSIKQAFDNGDLPKAYYVATTDDVVWMDDVLESLKRLHDEDYTCIIITNQEHIGCGITSEHDWQNLMQFMDSEIEAAGGNITDWFYCPHAPDALCECRKRSKNPGTELFSRAAIAHGFDLENSIMAGDNPSDIISGNAVGCTTVHIPLPMVEEKDKHAPSDFTCSGIKEVVDLILSLFP